MQAGAAIPSQMPVIIMGYLTGGIVPRQVPVFELAIETGAVSVTRLQFVPTARVSGCTCGDARDEGVQRDAQDESGAGVLGTDGGVSGGVVGDCC